MRSAARPSVRVSTCLPPPPPQHGPKLALYLYEMLHDHKGSLTKDEQLAVGVFMTTLKLCGHRCIPPGAPAKPDLLKAIKEVGTGRGPPGGGTRTPSVTARSETACLNALHVSCRSS